MNSFLKAEWKTIVAVTLFCGAIFGWFYYQETLNIEAEEASYEYTCIFAGEGLLSDKLGMTYDELAPKLSGFLKSEDKTIDTTSFESPDHIITYHFRQNRLASIEYYPDMNNLDEACAADFEQFKKTHSQKSAPILSQDKKTIAYEGLVIVQGKIKNTNETESSFNNDDNEVKLRDIGWIILPV